MKFKVCHIITRLVQGGADENTLYSCNSQVELGYEVYLIIGQEYEEEIVNKLDPKVKLFKVNEMKRKISLVSDILATKEIYRLLKEIQPEIVHTHTSKAGFVGRVAAYFASTKIIIHGVHILPFLNVDVFERFLYLKAEQLIAKITDCFISVSKGMQLCCLTHQIGEPEQHFIVESGMDIEKFKKSGSLSYDWRELISTELIDIEEPRFITIISRLESRKGQLDFISLFKQISSEYEDVILLIVGNGEDYHKIKETVKNLKLENRVVLTGRRDDVEKLMALSEVCILSSKREGLPRVLIQYLAVNRPVLTTECEGLESLIEHKQNAYIVKDIKSEETLTYLRELLDSYEKRKELMYQNSSLDFSKWDIKEMSNELNQIYQSLLLEKGLIPKPEKEIVRCKD